MADATLFRFEQAGFGYAGRTVLRGVNLAIQPGERIALVGESGAGKTTLLRQLRLQRPQEVAWCPQHPGLVPMLTVFHNIYMGRLDRNPLWYNLANLVHPLARARVEVTELAQALGLFELLMTSVDRLSGGQQSRVGLGRALYQQRPVFLGDEPVSAVDEVQADQLLELICSRHQTVVVALHDVDLALRHCTRIIGLKQGQIVLDAARETLTAERLLALYAS